MILSTIVANHHLWRWKHLWHLTWDARKSTSLGNSPRPALRLMRFRFNSRKATFGWTCSPFQLTGLTGKSATTTSETSPTTFRSVLALRPACVLTLATDGEGGPSPQDRAVPPLSSAFSLTPLLAEVWNVCRRLSPSAPKTQQLYPSLLPRKQTHQLPLKLAETALGDKPSQTWTNGNNPPSNRTTRVLTGTRTSNSSSKSVV